MKRLLMWTLVASAVLCRFSVPAYAWDGDRKGFVLGFGAGPGYAENSGGWKNPRGGLQTNLRFGYAPSARWVIHYNGQQFWGRYAMLHPALGCSYYLRDRGPCAFVTAAVGGSYLFSESWIESDGGGRAGLPVFHLGAGYEPVPHLSGELDAVITMTPGSSTRGLNVALMVNILGY